jgi:methylmalonyl-CoA mutase
MSGDVEVYKPRHAVRVVTATSLFDGHDAAINIFRRILQSTGVEVIHLGHNRAVQEIVDAAVQEDVQGIAISSYQGGHVEFFQYMVDLLKQGGGGHIKVFGGGGGVIVPEEIEALHAYGVTRIYTPEDGARMGLQGIINHLVETIDFSRVPATLPDVGALTTSNAALVANLITVAEQSQDSSAALSTALQGALQPRLAEKKAPVIGITGTADRVSPPLPMS